jgi:FKBP-type peptidyl-prolyl cis-trans isomerase FklB
MVIREFRTPTNIKSILTMKRSIIHCLAGLAFAATSAVAQDEKKAEAAKPEAAKPAPPKETTEHRDPKIVSYLIGADIGANMKRNDIELDVERFTAGLKAALAESELEFSQEDTRRILQAFSQDRQTAMRKKQQLDAFGLKTVEEWDALAAKNKADGAAFLAENGKKEGVKTLPSGLQYQVIKAGEGAIPKSTDRVKAIYKGTLADGTVFDESRGGNPTQFSVRGVIKGWTEALQMMPVGSKWKLFIPGDLAYGDTGRRPPIGPNQMLLFDIELTEISKPISATTPPVRAPSVTPGTKTPRIDPKTGKPRKPITATTPPVAVEFPKEKGGKIKVTPVDPKTGEPTGESKFIEPKGEPKKEVNGEVPEKKK